jgi:regulator of sigma E protease
MAIVLAGPLANLLLAILLYWGLFMMGVIGAKPIVGNVIEKSPAAVAGISAGEIIQKINGKDVASWQDVRWLLLKESLKNNTVEIQSVNNKQQAYTRQINIPLFDDDVSQDVL